MVKTYAPEQVVQQGACNVLCTAPSGTSQIVGHWESGYTPVLSREQILQVRRNAGGA